MGISGMAVTAFYFYTLLFLGQAELHFHGGLTIVTFVIVVGHNRKEPAPCGPIN